MKIRAHSRLIYCTPLPSLLSSPLLPSPQSSYSTSTSTSRFLLRPIPIRLLALLSLYSHSNSVPPSAPLSSPLLLPFSMKCVLMGCDAMDLQRELTDKRRSTLPSHTHTHPQSPHIRCSSNFTHFTCALGLHTVDLYLCICLIFTSPRFRIASSPLSSLLLCCAVHCGHVRSGPVGLVVARGRTPGSYECE